MHYFQRIVGEQARTTISLPRYSINCPTKHALHFSNLQWAMFFCLIFCNVWAVNQYLCEHLIISTNGDMRNCDEMFAWFKLIPLTIPLLRQNDLLGADVLISYASKREILLIVTGVLGAASRIRWEKLNDDPERWRDFLVNMLISKSIISTSLSTRMTPIGLQFELTLD